MEFRPGTCSSCKASFRIPASFTANMAKCSKCGGVVEIGPVTSDSKPADKPAVPPVPAKAISAPIAGAAARLAAKPESQPTPPVPAKPIAARPPPLAASAPKPAVAPNPAVEPKLAAKPSVAPAAKAAPISSAKAAPLSSAKAKPTSSRSAPEEDEDSGRESRKERRERLEKSRGPNPMLIGGALIGTALVAIAVFFAYSNFDKHRTESMAKAAAERQALADAQAKDEAARAAAAEIETKKAEEAAKLAREARDAEKAAKADAKHKKGDVLAAESSPGAAKAADPASSKPVEGYDLSTIPDFGPAEGTTPEQWTELQSLAATFMDFSAGARSAKAGVKLESTPKQSFPAILNEFKKLKLEEDNGFRMADATQKMLERMCHGNNFTWRYPQDKDYVNWNQKVIKKWCDAWTKASTDEAYWNKLTKSGGADTAEAPAGAPAKKVDDF